MGTSRGALVIIVLGESVVDIGIGAEGHAVTVSLALSAVLGLALTAALWWTYFGTEDDERAERAMVAADPAARPALALALLTLIVAAALVAERRAGRTDGRVAVDSVKA